jgi:hypothetical protein
MIFMLAKDRQRMQLLNTVEYLIDRHAKNLFFLPHPRPLSNWRWELFCLAVWEFFERSASIFFHHYATKESSFLRWFAEKETSAQAAAVACALAFSPSADGVVRGGLRKQPF